MMGNVMGEAYRVIRERENEILEKEKENQKRRVSASFDELGVHVTIEQLGQKPIKSFFGKNEFGYETICILLSELLF